MKSDSTTRSCDEVRFGEKATGYAVTRRKLLVYSSLSAAPLIMPGLSRGQESIPSVKIGHIQSLTGPSSPYGIRARDGAIMAVDEINRNGGIYDSRGNRYKLNMMVSDMANDPKQAIILFRQYALENDIIATMGPTNSVGFLPCIPVAGRYKMPLISNGSGAPVNQWNRWTYRINPVSRTATPSFIHTVLHTEPIRRLAVIYDLTQDAQVGDARIVRKLADQYGYEVVAHEAFRNGDQDFSAQLNKIRYRKPDAVFVAATTGDGVRLVTQLRELNITIPLLTGYGAFFDPVYWNGTNGGIMNCYTWVSHYTSDNRTLLEEWIRQYNKRFDLKATSFSIYGYETVYLIKECIERIAILNRVNLMTHLGKIQFKTPLNSCITMRNPPTGNNQTPSIDTIKITGENDAVAISNVGHR